MSETVLKMILKFNEMGLISSLNYLQSTESIVMNPPPEKEELDAAKVVLVGDEDDILHAGYPFTLKQEGKRFPSVLHYVYAKVLQHFSLQEEHVFDILSTPILEVVAKAYKMLEEKLNPGTNLSQFSAIIRQTMQYYLMQGLRIRSEQDENFRTNLCSTKDALLIVCDEKDSELGVGMSDKTFYEFWSANGYKMQDLSDWMLKEYQRPKSVGQNILGCMLMLRRHELREAERFKCLKNPEFSFEGLSTVDENPMTVTANCQILSLSGVLRPLSNYYRSIFDVKEISYRSVEHYAYERLFESLKIDEIYVQQLRSVPYPVDVAAVGIRILESLEAEKPDWRHKMAKLDRYRQTAMKHKISKNGDLRQLLLNTGNAFLVETNPYGDDVWTVNTDEYELQHLLTKPGIDISYLVEIMCRRKDPSPTLKHLGQNKTGILLMELRQKYANASFIPYPFIAPPDMNIQRLGLSNNIICFTPESIFHPFYPVPIIVTKDLTVPSPIHYVILYSCRFLGLKPALEEDLLSLSDGYEAWSRFNCFLQTETNVPFDKLKAYFMSERQKLIKISLALMFTQHPAVLRVLLETEDALLIYCARFSTIEAELCSGLRERDFRRVFQESQSDMRELVEFFLKPQAYRPPYIGGNRLGLIIMELRRQFVLGGCYPSAYQILPMQIEGKLGTDSPTENYVCDKQFKAIKKINFTSTWADPLILAFKDSEGYRKPARGYPTFLRDDENASEALGNDFIKDKQNLINSFKGTGPGLAYSAALLVTKRLNELLLGAERKAIDIKHGIDCTLSCNNDPKEDKPKESLPPPPQIQPAAQQTIQPQQMPSLPSLPPPQLPQFAMNLNPQAFNLPPPSQLQHLQSQIPQFSQQQQRPLQPQQQQQRFYDRSNQPPQNNQQQNFYPQQQRNDFRGNNNDRFGGVGNVGQNNANNNFRDRRERDDRNMRNRTFNNSPSRNNTRNYNNYRGPAHLQQQHENGNRNFSPARDQQQQQQYPERAPPPSPPKAKKPKRVVDESELSEGEIVDSDED
uniref:NADAR domain-containing protein n=1 Tax=Panagrolaimus sp. PS1159 TaxID=55785 RepID=A0AC35ETS1_9BILA